MLKELLKMWQDIGNEPATDAATRKARGLGMQIIGLLQANDDFIIEDSDWLAITDQDMRKTMAIAGIVLMINTEVRDVFQKAGL